MSFYAEFLNLTECLCIKQYIDVPTYNGGQTLDLVFKDSTLVNSLQVYDLGVSDGKVISKDLSLQCLSSKTKIKHLKSYYNWAGMDPIIMKKDPQNISHHSCISVAEPVHFYISGLCV